LRFGLLLTHLLVAYFLGSGDKQVTLNLSSETASRHYKSGKHGAISGGLSKNSHTLARATMVSNASSKCNITSRSATCHSERKTVRVSCNTDHHLQHSSEQHLYEHVKSKHWLPAFYGSKLLIHSIADKRIRSGG
jgi:hypothetical protein